MSKKSLYIAGAAFAALMLGANGAMAQDAPVTVVDWSTGSPRWTTEDGEFQFKLRGRLMADAYAIDADFDERTGVATRDESYSGFGTRRACLGVEVNSTGYLNSVLKQVSWAAQQIGKTFMLNMLQMACLFGLVTMLRLTLADADPIAGVLRIRESKFHKSLFVPLSLDACRELRAYLRKRLVPPLSTAPDSPLLCNCTRGLRPYTGTGLSRGLQLLIRAANVRSPDGRRPRVHDFRHSFAVGALLRWYRQGADVQSNLPKLAMYMGHVSIVSTAYYLKWLPDIAAGASERFETHFGHLINGGTS